MRFSAGGRSAGGSTTLPIAALCGTANGNGHLREIGISNTSATAAALRLCRLSTAGTPGTGLTETSHDYLGGTANCAAFNSYTSTAPTTTDLGMNVSLGAAIGSAWVWTFGGEGLLVPVGTANGVGIIVATGTVAASAFDFYFVWDE